MLLEDLVRIRRPRFTTLLAGAVFAVPAAVQCLCLHGPGDYLTSLAAGPGDLPRHAVAYAQRLAAFWSNGYWQPGRGRVAAGVTLLAVGGFRQRLRDKITVYEIFTLLYLATILAWPGYSGERLLLPILPLWLSTPCPASSIPGCWPAAAARTGDRRAAGGRLGHVRRALDQSRKTRSPPTGWPARRGGDVRLHRQPHAAFRRDRFHQASHHGVVGRPPRVGLPSAGR